MNQKEVARHLIFGAMQHEETPTVTALRDRFESEYHWLIARLGRRKAAKEWLQGLALHVPYATHEIEALGFTDDLTETGYWAMMGDALVSVIAGGVK